MKIGFTGTREGMTYEQKRTIASLLAYYRANHNAEEFHHGMCVGADDEAALIADNLRYVTVAHPADYVVMYRGNYKSDVTFPAKPFLKRNQDIARQTDMMIATPKEFVEPPPLRGQGTWSAIRFSRDKQKKHTIIIWPDGSCVA